MPKKGERRPWRVRFVWMASGISGTEVRSTEDEARAFAGELFKTAKLRESAVQVTIENRDTKETYPVSAQPETHRHGRTKTGRVAHELVKANEHPALCGTVSEVFLTLEEADDMPMCTRCDVISVAQMEETDTVAKPSAAELKADVEAALTALETADSGEKITGLEEHAEETLLQIAAGPRTQLRMRLKEAVAKADDRLEKASKAVSKPNDYTMVAGSEALIAAGVEKIRHGVDLWGQAGNVAREISELQLTGALAAPLYRGLPDLKKASAPSQSLAREMYAAALEGVTDEETKEVHKALQKNVQNYNVDTTVKYLRSLNDEGSAESFAETFPMISVAEGQTREAAVRAAYAAIGMTFPTLTRAEQAAELRAKAKAPKEVEAEGAPESSDAGAAVVDAVKTIGSEARRITPTVKKMSDEEKDAARKVVRDAMGDMQKLLTALL